MGVAYNLSDYTTVFTENNVIIVNSSNELSSAISTAASNTAIDAIHLTPGPTYTLPTNAFDSVVRPVTRPLVIRTRTGYTPRAVIQDIVQNHKIGGGLAICDINFNGTVTLQGGGDNLQFESCVFGDQLTIQGDRTGPQTPGPNPMNNVIIRLCTFANHYRNNSNLIHGYFCFNVYGQLMEGNVLDHNGWGPSMTRATPASSGGPSIRKHNVYSNRPGDDHFFRFNFSSRASSHGYHGKQGGYCYDNLFVRNPISYQMGYGDDNTETLFGLTSGNYYYNNITIDADDINTSNNDYRGVNATVTCAVSSFFTNNIAIDNTTVPKASSQDAFIVLEQDHPIGVTVSGCITKNWSPYFYHYGSGSAAVNVIDDGTNQHEVTGLSSAAQTLVDSLKTDAYINALVAAGNGVDIDQLKADMATIRAGIIP